LPGTGCSSLKHKKSVCRNPHRGLSFKWKSKEIYFRKANMNFLPQAPKWRGHIHCLQRQMRHQCVGQLVQDHFQHTEATAP
jgi:hypothetical protein